MKKSSFFRNCLLGITFFSIFISCKSNIENVPSGEIVPEPSIVDQVSVTSDTVVYYLINIGQNSERLNNGPEPILKELLENGLTLRSAWYPNTTTPCMVLNAVEALVVELTKPDAKILNFGFISNPEPWKINCGIQSFRYYKFN